jgi:MSHA pilin protein MshD
MNTGQMILSIGAIVLLSTIVLRVNNSFLTTNEVMSESKFGVLAVSLAQSIIEEASNKAFDAQTAGNAIHDSTLLTSPGGLGPNSSEHYPNFNDFDDFNGYTRDVTNLPSATYHISCVVTYINAAQPDLAANHTTWNKKITVTVTSPFSKDTVKLSSIFSYWYF